MTSTKFALENGRSVRRKCFFRRRNSNFIRQDSVSSEEVNVSFESHRATKNISAAKVTRGHVCSSLVTTILLYPPKIVCCRKKS